MKKALVIIFAIILMVGVSGCGTAPTAQDKHTLAEIYNAATIVNAINAYNALNPGSVLPDNLTLQDAKEIIGEELWPRGISDEDTGAVWKWIIIRNGKAGLTPEAQEVWDNTI